MIRSAYVHVPFCRQQCGYCNSSNVAGHGDLATPYIDALSREIDQAFDSQQMSAPHSLDTLFLAGGNLTQFTGDKLVRLLLMVRKRFNLDATAEFSCEVHPLDCTDEALSILLSGGVSRLVIVGPSFSSRKLQLLEGNSTSDDLRAAIARAKDYIPSVAVDLIFATPDETLEEWRTDLQEVIAAEAHHVSTHISSVEREYGSVAKVDNDLRLEMYQAAIEDLTAAGFENYGASSFAKRKHACRHNVNLWSNAQFFSFGPAAANLLQANRSDNPPSAGMYRPAAMQCR